MIWLAVLRRFWWAVPLLFLTATAGVYRVQRDRARSQLADAQVEIHRARGVIDRMTAADQAAADQAAHDKAEADAKYESAIRANTLVADDLRRRVYAYATRPSTGPGPVPNSGIVEEPPGVDPVPAAIADALAACTRDVGRLQNAVEWAATVSHDSTAPTRP